MRYVNNASDDWDEYLHSVAFAYRINRQSSTKFSPFELLYGIKARLPVDLVKQAEDLFTWEEEPSEEMCKQRMADFTERIQGTRDQAKANISAAQVVQKRVYDIKHRAPTYQVSYLLLLQ